MVADDTINRCMRCDKELLTRAEIELLVSGKKELKKDRDLMRWDTYMSGSAFIYAEFNGVTGSKGETKNVVCGCNVAWAATPSLTMIRQEFRQMIAEKFGDRLTLPFLFRIPSSMVAWENSAFVGYQPGVGGLQLTAEGTKLVDVIAEMSKLGIFRGGMSSYSDEDVVTGFSYLYMVKPEWRAFAAMLFGSEVSVSSFFSRVDLTWLDWETMPLLSCAIVDDRLQVHRVPGAPLVETLFVELSKVASFRAYASEAQSVAPGSSVTLNNACFQISPGAECTDYAPEPDGESRAPVVQLEGGQAFIPSGGVLLGADKLAVTFEPGVELVVRGGTVLQAPLGSVTLFLDGTVEVFIRPRGAKGKSDGFVRQYQVAVVCEKYGDDDALAAWYARRFDVTSTAARFFSQEAAIIILYHPVRRLLGVTKLRDKINEDGTDEEEGVTTVRHCVDDTQAGYVDLPGRECVVSEVFPRTFEFSGAVMCGVVRLSITSRVGVLTSGYVTFKASNDKNPSPYGAQYRVAEISDEYVLDGGGPSDSEGFCDEMVTHVPSKSYNAVWRRRNVGTWPEYTRIARWPGNMVSALGADPNIHELLAVDVALVDLDNLSDTGWALMPGGSWHVVERVVATLSWKRLVRMAVSWEGFADTAWAPVDIEGTLLRALCIKYNVSSRVPTARSLVR